MDIEKYIKGKSLGSSGMELQGDSTILIKCHAGYDDDGNLKPPTEQGFQPADLVAMHKAAQEAADKANALVAMHDDLLADAAVFQPQIEANLKAAQKVAKP